MIRLLMFDLDGTLVDTAAEIADAVNDALTHTGWDPLPADLIRNWIGQGARATVRRALQERTGLSGADAALEVLLDATMQAYPSAHRRRCGTRSGVYPQVRSTLETLQRRGVLMAVLTNKEAALTAQVLSHHGLAAYFDPIVAGDTLAACKPSPLPVQHCLRHHGVAADEAVLVGDSAVDAATARNAGVRFWAVPYGYNGGQPIATARPDQLLPDFHAVLDLIAIEHRTPGPEDAPVADIGG